MGLIVKPVKAPVQTSPVSSEIDGNSLPYDAGEGGGVPVVYGLSGWATTDFYRTAGGEGVGKAGASAHWCSVVVRVDAVPTTTEYLTGIGLTGSGNGFDIFVNFATTPNLVYQVTDGVGTQQTSNSRTIVAGDVGKVFVITGVHDGSNIHLYVNGAEIGTEVACSGYTGFGTLYHSIGTQRGALTPASSFTILGVAGEDVTLSAANVLAHAQACKAEGDIADIGSATHIWSVKQDAQSVPTEWVNAVGGTEHMDKTGTALALDIFTPQWSF